MTLGQEIAESRTKISRLRLELHQEENRLRKLESSCTHEREAFGAIIISISINLYLQANILKIRNLYTL